MELLNLFVTFFKLGLFTIGGGLAALPLLQEEAISQGWLTAAEFADIIAVSQSTPGPIGVNMATYVGFNQYGFLGALIATLGLITPSIIIIILIARFFHHFNEKRIVQDAFSGVRPAVTGLIAVAAYNVATVALLPALDWKKTVLFIAIGCGIFILKKHPIIYIGIAALGGIFFL